MSSTSPIKQSPITGLVAFGGGSGSYLLGRKGIGGYVIQRSLRLNSADSAYLNRTPSSSSNRKTWTWSGWVKRSKITASQNLFGVRGASAGEADSFSMQFGGYGTGAGNLVIGYGNAAWKITSQVFRDLSAWYHIVVAFDSTQSTGTDRVKLYVNGSQVTDFDTDTAPTSSLDSAINSTAEHRLGSYASVAPQYIDTYLADVHFIDGQALAPTVFGATDADTGVWNPKEYDGTYGTNGWKLNFSDNTSTTTLAEDSSGNNNDWTANNLSVASGAGNDSLIDTPTNYEADSGNNGGNYATLNPLANSGLTLSNGNLDFTSSGGNRDTCIATHGVSSGKWYWEVTVGDNAIGVGIEPEGYYPASDSRTGLDSAGYSWWLDRQKKYNNNGTNSSYGASVSSGDVIGVALDLDGGTLTFYKNNSSQGTAFTGISGTYLPAISDVSNALSMSGNINFGARPFAYTPPSNHLPLVTTNLTDPTIADGSTAMDVALWTGNGSTQSISGLSMSPDLVWVKQRNTSRNHQLVDTVRGATKDLRSNTTAAESTTSTGLTAFTSDGFTLGGDAGYNQSSGTYVGWTWDAGANSNKTFTVKVVSDSGNKYRFDDFGTSAVTLDLEEGSTYVFDQSDSSNSGHPLRFSTTSDGTHGGGSEYTTGVTVEGTPGSAGAKTTIVVAASAPTLYYYCSVHSGMGGQADTNSTAGASNFDGSIQATVRANQSSGFSIVSYTGDGSGTDTIGHGLNDAPSLVITKSRGTTGSWRVFTDVGGTWKLGNLNNTDAFVNATVSAPTSSVFSIDGNSNASTTHIAYCFAPVVGYSASGSYTGNDGSQFIYTGFRPRFLLIKGAGSTTNQSYVSWALIDSERDSYNVAGTDSILWANRNVAEGYRGDGSTATTSGNKVDLLSNGFALPSVLNLELNSANVGTYVWAAFAEHPFKTARAR